LVRDGVDPGAYNIYEEDLRVGRIVSVVGMVGSQIIKTIREEAAIIQANQGTLYGAMQKSIEISTMTSKQLENISSRVGEISTRIDEVRGSIDKGNDIQLQQSQKKSERYLKLLVDSQRSRGYVRNRDGDIMDMFD
jgi:hypothetical protein